MIKLKNLKKPAIILLVFVIQVCLISGCNNRSYSNSENSAQKLVEKEPNKDQVKKSYDSALQTLVNDATITKDQAATILNALMSNVNNVGKESKEKSKETLNKLVENKTITQQQSDKIMNALEINK